MVENIVLEIPPSVSPSLTPPEPSRRQVDLTYNHKARFSNGQTVFRLFNQKYIHIEHSAQANKPPQVVAFHVGMLQSKLGTARRVNWYLLAASLVAMLAAIICIFTAAQPLVGLALAITGLLILCLVYLRYRSQILVCSLEGGAPILAISRRCESREELLRFCKALTISIERNALPATRPYLAEEVRWLSQLKESGWLSEGNYTNARAKIMQAFNRT